MPGLVKRKSKYFVSFIIAFLTLTAFHIAFAQETVRMMSYNLNDYAADTSRNADFVSIVSAINPDILVAIELTSSSSATKFLNNVLNQTGNGTYSMGTFISNPNNPSDNNAIYFKSSHFSHVNSSIVISSGNHPTYKFILQYSPGVQVIIFGVHFTSATSSNPEQARYDEATAIRTITDQYQNGEYFIAMGDFNLTNSNEVVPNHTYGAFKTLVGTINSGNFIDPAGFDGTSSWSSSTYSYLRTFTTKLTSSSFVSRFDLILNSQSVINTGGIKYIPGSFTIAGNFSGSFSNIPSSYKSASDHLPVYADYSFPAIPVPVELSSFTADLNGNMIDLHWKTETEVNNYGFNIERLLQPVETEWETIGFIEGNGNSNSPKFYNYCDQDITTSGTINYRLKQMDNDGSYEYSKVVTIEMGKPVDFYLSQNFPNPFNPSTIIKYSVPYFGMVTLKVYDILGNEIATLVNGEQSPGNYEIEFNVNSGSALNLSSGIYIYRITSGNYTITKKMILQK